MTYQTIGLLCSVWDDPRGIMRMLDQPTIKDFDFLCFFDGKFSNWEGDPEFPEDEVFNIIKDWSDQVDVNNVMYELVLNKTEAEKRNHMFYRASQIEMDWALVVDADEIPKIDKSRWYSEQQELSQSSFGCHSVLLDNYKLVQRRPRLFNMKERPYLLQFEDKTSHNHIWSGVDGRDLATDITKTNYDVKSISLTHDKEFYSDYRFECRRKFSTVGNH